ncbi:MAG: c(7)-type cytochrome triheme domain-containing protein [Nitrospirota bacterium]
MKITVMSVLLIIAIAFVGSAIASGPGKTVEYPGGEQGKVIFKGDTHGVKQGMKCPDCHPKLFQMKKGSLKMTKEDHGDTTKGCGVCHNGEKAFSQSNEADCGKCHIKEEAPAPAAPAVPEAPAAPAAPPEQPAPAEPEKK